MSMGPSRGKRTCPLFRQGASTSADFDEHEKRVPTPVHQYVKYFTKGRDLYVIMKPWTRYL